MSKEKKFKARVRHRMTQTGESYVAARRSLEGSRPVIPLHEYMLLSTHLYTGVGSDAAQDLEDQHAVAVLGLVKFSGDIKKRILPPCIYPPHLPQVIPIRSPKGFSLRGLPEAPKDYSSHTVSYDTLYELVGAWGKRKHHSLLGVRDRNTNSFGFVDDSDGTVHMVGFTNVVDTDDWDAIRILTGLPQPQEHFTSGTPEEFFTSSWDHRYLIDPVNSEYGLVLYEERAMDPTLTHTYSELQDLWLGDAEFWGSVRIAPPGNLQPTRLYATGPVSPYFSYTGEPSAVVVKKATPKEPA